ncbi:HAMP domain-containing protein [Azospirillum soli]|uniref:HAMP domain-containing protein n=1 Tax=Azospirillum soli TaxID=1304799 RepID=UPI001B3BA4AE|nr:HAMP domain-containing protein [Azospirillum soli]MBP2314648.1 HAMP domain-containing protein/signal transduction histidine kinase/CheY-like chemotaxis protein [Azospirillum soli]
MPETTDLELSARDLLAALRRFKKGDFSVRLPLHFTGIDGEIAEAFNDVVELNEQMTEEFGRLSSVVGKEGKISQRAKLSSATGKWEKCVDSINTLIGDLVQPTNEVARVIGAVAKGDLSQTMVLEIDGRPLRGEFLRIGKIVNTMVGQLNSFASEVTRVAREVGTEGKLGGQARVEGVAGTWKDLTDNVNAMAANLTAQVRNIAEVTTAVANGDLSKKITVDVKGEILELKNTINIMVDQLGSFASEVTRVAREVGTEGRLGGQAVVKGVAGTWKDLTDNVNLMATNLTAQVRNIAEVTTAVAKGDLSKKITVDVKGEILELKNTINTMVDQLNSFASEVTRVAREVGTEGKLGGQAQVEGVAGTWKDLTDNVNAMAANLTNQVRNIAEVTTAVANGDLSKKITVDVKGEILELKNTINTMVDQLNSFASEVTRVAREVGSEGKLGGQAQVKGVAGTWKDLTDSVNAMATNLTAQVRNIAEVTTAVANGDLSKKITVDVKGEILELKNTINTMVDQLNSFASEVTRVAREVGTEGRLGGQARVEGVAGTWKDLTDNVNLMATNLTAQVRNIAEVTTAVAKGDLSKKITVDVKGEILELKNTINIMVDQLGSFASEVTRVAREVGTEGKLGGQAQVEGVAGTWKDLTDNVNAMATNLTAQVRNIAEVTTAVANGDLSKKITVDVKGEILELKNTINTMVDQLGSFASEVTRVAREVGTEGRLGGQAVVKGVAGTWKDLTDNVNLMATNLTAQVRNIAEVTTAVAKGDLSKKITVDVKGEILELKNTINIMVDQLGSFASEVTRVAREVGTEGKLGGQAQVEGVAGTWKDLTDNVNAMAANLTNQVRNIAEVTTAVANGDLSKKITVDVRGEILELKNTINTMVDQLNSFASEVTRVAREVGTEGKLGGQAVVKGVAGTWKDLTDNVNLLTGNLTNQVRNIAEVTTAVANGDLSKKITVDVKGEILELKNTINTMVDQLNSFASEVTRVAREVGTEGKLGGQAVVKGVAGTWKDLTDNVNMMATNLTNQVRGIAEVVTAVAQGNLKRKLTVDAKGEIAALADTINGMIETLAIFADQVTNVAREVGIEGKLGGQAKVPGATGVWRDLTDNVNQLAANLTTQVRAIAEVATAVTKGDLTRSITVEASGEVAALKDNINEMIRNLKDTTLKNAEQDWLKTNLAKFTRMLQGERDLVTVSNLILSELAPLVNAQHGVFYIANPEGEEVSFDLVASYAYKTRKHLSNSFRLREGLVGQCAFEKQPILLTSVPPDYIQINSGLGEAPPLNIIVLPVLFEGEVKAVIELAAFSLFSETHRSFLDQLMESIGIVLNTIAATMRTEGLLKQSQLLTAELQSQQEELKKTNDRLEQQATSLRQSEEMLKNQQDELRRTNEELEEKAELLSRQKMQVEAKNREVEMAKRALEEKAEQLALTSKYKSEFLANMSHELRTPLNSLLILSKLLSDNPQGNLNDKQIEFSRTIHAAGSDLLALINDILDLSKIESGTVSIEVGDVQVPDMVEHLERSFRQVAQNKKLSFAIEMHEELPKVIRTDEKRLQQVINNLLANAFKFTDSGSVTLSIGPAAEGWSPNNASLSSAPQVLAFSVTDTGIGVPEDKQKIIFEAFQQADGTTSRKYGGTGLGLSISREIAQRLGGEIRVTSAPGAGSTFTLYLPVRYEAGADRAICGPANPATVAAERFMLTQTDHHDDREALTGGDMVMLLVEPDATAARSIMELAREKDFKVVLSHTGNGAIPLIRKVRPSAITIDLHLPDIDGLALLEQIKHDLDLRHIPVHVIAPEESRHRCRDVGAFGVTTTPVDPQKLSAAFTALRGIVARDVMRLLVVVGDAELREQLVARIGGEDVQITEAGSAKEAQRLLANEVFDCAVLGSGLPRSSMLPLIERIRDNQPALPVVVYRRKPLPDAEAEKLDVLAQSVLLRQAGTPEQLLDETARLLHRPLSNLRPEDRETLEAMRQDQNALAGRTVLLIDDDIRNIFSMTSVLEQYRMNVVFAENGRDGIELLKSTPGIDAALVDVMMPEMDGYEVMQEIRGIDGFQDLPLIAVTAKAMQGDREKCLEAGASDYIAKPVEVDRLLATLRAWLNR